MTPSSDGPSHNPPSAVRPQPPPEKEAVDRLVFDLELQTGFWFSMVVSEDRGPRYRVRAAARQWCIAHKVAFYQHFPSAEELPEMAALLLHDARPGLHWVVADGQMLAPDLWTEAAGAFFMGLNERREAYRRQFVGGLVVEGEPELKRQLRTLAPDLFSIRAAILDAGQDPVRKGRAEPTSIVGPAFDMGIGSPARWLTRADRLTGQVGVGVELARVEALDLAASSLTHDQQRPRALQVARQAYELAEVLYSEDSEAPWAARGRVLTRFRLGVLTCRTGDPGQGAELFAEAIALVTAQVERFRYAHYARLVLARLHHWYGYSLQQLGDQEGALAEAEAALAAFEALAAETPLDAWLVGNCVQQQLNLARLLRRLGRDAEEGQALRAGLHRATELFDEYPFVEAWCDLRVRCLDRLGRWHQNRGDLKVARERYFDCVRTVERWARAAWSEAHRRERLAKTRVDVAVRLISAGRPEDAGALAQEANRELLGESEPAPRWAARQLAAAHSLLAKLASDANDFDLAVHHSATSLRVNLPLVQGEGVLGADVRDHARREVALGRLLSSRGERQRAIDHLSTALSLLDELATLEPDRVLDLDLRRSGLRQLAQLAREARDLKACEQHCLQMLEAARRLAALRPDDIRRQRALQNDLILLSEVLEDQGLIQRAVEVAWESVAVSRALIDLEGAQKGALQRCRLSLENAGRLYKMLGQSRKAKAVLQDALALARRESVGTSHSSVVDRIERALKRL